MISSQGLCDNLKVLVSIVQSDCWYLGREHQFYKSVPWCNSLSDECLSGETLPEWLITYPRGKLGIT